MKRILFYPFLALESLFDRALAIVGSVSLAQFPQFYSQYLQRLGGHLDEARRIVAEYSEAAASFNLSLHDYIGIHQSASNPVLQSTGSIIDNSLARLGQLERSFQALENSTLFNRWWLFLKNLDPAIFSQTCSQYTPGLPLTIESLFYALAGLLIICGIYQGIKWIIKKLFYKFTHSGSITNRQWLSGRSSTS